MGDNAQVAQEALANWLAYLVHAREHAELGDNIPARTLFGYSDCPVSFVDEDGVARAATLTTLVWR